MGVPQLAPAHSCSRASCARACDGDSGGLARSGGLPLLGLLSPGLLRPGLLSPLPLPPLPPPPLTRSPLPTRFSEPCCSKQAPSLYRWSGESAVR